MRKGLKLLFVALIILFAAVIVISGEQAVAGIFSGETSLKSVNNDSQITLPKGWKEHKDLNDAADLQAAYLRKELYIIVLSESKEDFEKMTIEKHSDLTRGGIVESLTSSEEKRLPDVKINGNPAIQYEISGVIGNVKITYIHTTVETKENYHQILAWTLKSRYKKNKPELQKVIQSFKEI